MKITLNGQIITTQQTTLNALLTEQGYGADSNIATALNGEFVAKNQRADTLLNESCSVDVVAPMQGG